MVCRGARLYYLLYLSVTLLITNFNAIYFDIFLWSNNNTLMINVLFVIVD